MPSQAEAGKMKENGSIVALGASPPSRSMRSLLVVIMGMIICLAFAFRWIDMAGTNFIFCSYTKRPIIVQSGPGENISTISHGERQSTHNPSTESEDLSDIIHEEKPIVDKSSDLGPGENTSTISHGERQSIHNPSTKSGELSNIIHEEKPIADKSSDLGESISNDLQSTNTEKTRANKHGDKSITHHESESVSCDYSRGRWVPDKSRPLYSGSSCKRWLSGMWACRLMGRPDFDYEKYRWKPDQCDLPLFNASAFLSMMKNRVLAFVGDSIGRQQYQSMMCLLSGGREDVSVEDVSLQFGFIKPRGAIRADGTAQRFLETNTTILYYWSASLCLIEPLDKSSQDTDYAMHLDRPAAFLQSYINQFDVLVLNTGHHWNRGKLRANKWVMHVNGLPNTDKDLNNVGLAYNFTVHHVMSWLNQEIEKGHTKARVFMRSLSPRHFFNGEWDTGGRCDDNRTPVTEKNVTGMMSFDPVAESAVLGTKVKLLNVTYLSQFRDEAHISKYRGVRGDSGQDCLHWCLPGVPDVWNEVLYANLLLLRGLGKANHNNTSM